MATIYKKIEWCWWVFLFVHLCTEQVTNILIFKSFYLFHTHTHTHRTLRPKALPWSYTSKCSRSLFDQDSSGSFMSAVMGYLVSSYHPCYQSKCAQRIQGFHSNTVHLYWIINNSTCPTTSCLPSINSQLGDNLQKLNEKKKLNHTKWWKLQKDLVIGRVTFVIAVNTSGRFPPKKSIQKRKKGSNYAFKDLIIWAFLVLNQKKVAFPLWVRGDPLSQVREFHYFWALFTSEGSTQHEINNW